MNKLVSGRRALILLGALLVLGALNHAIAGKENIRRHGELIYLRLVPVDPRSLMQGDYMALRFKLARELESADEKSGHVQQEGETRHARIALDAHGVASLAAPGAQAPAQTPLRLRYRTRDGRIWLGTNAFFFEEGQAERFTDARYGEFRIDRESGEAVLVGLRDGALKSL